MQSSHISTCITNGAIIHYSTDNKANYSDYSGALALAPGTTLDAYATKDGFTQSDNMEQYTIPAAPSYFTITFANADGAIGVVPAAVENITSGTEITLPKNFSMYKEGYTMTGWTDGENNFALGASYEVTENKTLTAVYTANTVNLEDHVSAVTIKWDFSQSKGVPALHFEGNSGFVVAQAIVSGKTIDVKLPIDATSGKFANSANTWTQVNPGTIFTIPSENGAVITYKQYDASVETTPEINVSSTDATYALTAAGTSGQLYYEYVQVVLPSHLGPASSYNLIDNGAINTEDFYTGATIGGKVTIDEVEYDYAKLGGNATALNQNALNKYIAYCAKTSYTELKIKVKNNSTSNRVVNIYGLEEGATEPIVLQTCTLTNKQYLETEYIAYNGTKNRTIYIAVPSSCGDVFFVQVEAKEAGDALPMAGEIGYSFNLNKGRVFGPSGSANTFEGLTYYLSSNYSVFTSTEAKFSTLGTQYVKFTLPVRTKVIITTSNTAKYFVSTVCSTEDAAKTNETTPIANAATSFKLDAGTWYINPNGSNVQLTKLEFVAVPAEYTVTFNLQGHGEAIEAQTIDEGEKVAEPTAPIADGWKFGGWYKEAACTNAWDFENDVVNANTELFAKWTEAYTVSYFDGETLLGTEKVIGGENPTATGITTDRTPLYTFNGWYANAGLTGDALNLAEQTISENTSYYGKWTPSGNTTSIEMVWKKKSARCDETQTPDATTKSTDPTIAPYLTIRFSSVGDENNAEEGSSLNTGKVVGNTIIIAAEEGYTFETLHFFGKIQDASCEYSIDGGAWQTLTSTNTEGDACYEVFEDQDVHVFALRNTGTNGVWIRNMQIDVKASATTMKVYKRDVTAGDYATICLPYAVAATAHQNVTVYNIAGKRIGAGDVVTSIVLAEEEGALVAGLPYIFQSTSENATFIYTEANAAAAGSHHGLVGTLSAISVDAPYYLLAENTIVNAVAGSSLPANRAYIDMASVPEYNPSQAPGVRIVEIALNENNATDIQNIEGCEKAVKFFQNGNLYILRDGVVYDAMGKMVR